MRIARLVLATFLLATLGSPLQASATPTDRLYLLAADTDYLYWSPTANDPEASALGFTRTCRPGPVWYGGPDWKPCVMSGTAGSFASTLVFAPAGILEEPLSWGPGSPLRFHVAVTVESAVPYSVHFVTSSNGLIGPPQGERESQPATEVAPGIWEGSISTADQIKPGKSLLLGVRVRTQAQASTRVKLEMRTAGASFVDLPGPVASASVPELLRDSTYAPAPSSLVTEERAFAFNDGAWEHASFDGDLSVDRSFTFTTTAKAPIVLAWVEGLAEPFAYGVLHGDPGARKPTDTAIVHLSTGGEDLAANRYSVATLDVSGGEITVTIERIQQSGSFPYRAHVLVLYGSRTLAAMRWQTEVPTTFLRMPLASSCAALSQHVPSTDQVTTFRVDIDWDSPKPVADKWTVGFSIPEFNYSECGYLGTGDTVRVAAPGQRMSMVGPVPASDATTISAFDTRFEFEVRYAYTRAS